MDITIQQARAEIKALKPNDADWCKWADVQKRVENLTDGEGQNKTMKPIETLNKLFEAYTKKKAKAPSTTNRKSKVETIVASIDTINTIEDVEKLESAIKAKREAIEIANKQAKENEALKALQEALKYGITLQDLLNKAKQD